MRALVSFALGLWTGGLVVGCLWFWHTRATDLTADTAPTAAIVSVEEVRQLRQDNALLAAERARLRESLRESQERAARLAERRRAAPAEPLPSAPPQQVAPGQPIALADLERLASQGDAVALEALLTSAADGQQAVLRVWRSPTLTEAGRSLVTRYLNLVADSVIAEFEPGLPVE